MDKQKGSICKENVVFVSTNRSISLDFLKKTKIEPIVSYIIDTWFGCKVFENA